jgi:hypothetical protein
LAWLVAPTAAFCSEHSPGPGLAWLVATAPLCSEHSPGPGLAWLVAATPAFYSEHSRGRSAARPISGNTSCKLSIVPCAESPGTSKPRFPFAPQHKAFAHPVRTMLGGCFLLRWLWVWACGRILPCDSTLALVLLSVKWLEYGQSTIPFTIHRVILTHPRGAMSLEGVEHE